MTNLNKRAWYDIGSDVNWIGYGGRWARHIEGTRYHVIRFDNLEEHTGEAGAGYHCQLAEVDTQSEQLDSALECCGTNPDRLDDYGNQYPTPAWELMCAEALFSYGAAALLWQASGRNANTLVREAKSESRRLQRDASAYEQAMDRPVNAIGSTAWEYAAGDMLSGILRGVEAGDPKAELMLKMGVR